MTKPTPDEITAYAKSINFDLDGEQFCDFYESKGWKIGKSPMVSWQAAVRTWKRGRSGQASTPVHAQPTLTPREKALQEMK